MKRKVFSWLDRRNMIIKWFSGIILWILIVFVFPFCLPYMLMQDFIDRETYPR